MIHMNPFFWLYDVSTFYTLKWWEIMSDSRHQNLLLVLEVFLQNKSWKVINHRKITFKGDSDYGFLMFAYERVAVGRKYPCSRLPWFCLLWYLLQSLFHVQMGSNLNLGQSLYVHPLWLWVDDNLLAWSGAIHLYKKAIILAVNTAIYMVKVVLAGF